MKRTVTRWVSDKWDAESVGIGAPMSDFCKRLTITYDDGVTGCPCVKAPNDPGCCGFQRSSDGCCRCHCPSNDVPCLSPFHKKPEPATRERVTNGWVRRYNGGDPLDTHVFSPTKQPNYEPATLTIHEPVKEPTLYEAVAEHIRRQTETDDRPWALPNEILNAFEREKARREKEGK